MAKIDKLSLLSPAPIDFYGIPIYKPTLGEITGSIGVERYSKGTNLLTLSDIEINDFFKQNNITESDIEPFIFLLLNCQEPTFFLEVQSAFFTYLKKEIKCCELGFSVEIDGEERIIDREHFTEFQNVIRQINMNYDELDEREIITDNLAMKEKFMQKRKMLKEAKMKEKEKKSNSGEGLSLETIISGLCVYGVGYNMSNVWQLTIYQLYDQFTRCQKKESYDVGIKSLLAGASKKDVHLTNWLKD